MKRISFYLTAMAMLVFAKADACTNFLITKGASKDGSTMITYAADSHTLYGCLYYRPAANYPAGSMLDIYEWDSGRRLGQIKQAAHTYSVVGNMNEHQLSIAETTYGGRSEQVDTTGIMDYGSLIYVTLQRAKTAREAIKVIAELIAEYGYYSSGESFSIADPNEVWIMEMIGKGQKVMDKKGTIDPKKNAKGAVWVAARVPDGYISGHANHARITTFPKADGKKVLTSKQLAKINEPAVEWIYSEDVIDYARNIGIFNGKDTEFSFSDIYAPLDFSGARGCEARVWAGFMKANAAEAKKYESYARGEDLKNRMPLWIKPAQPLSLQDVFGLMRDHYEGTSLDMTKDAGAGAFELPYRWRPMGFTVNNVDYVHERAISTQQTAFSFIAQARSWMPNPVGGILWFGVDDSYSTVYVPMYCGITRIPESFREGNGNMMQYSATSAFWLFNQVSNFTYLRYKDMIVDVQKVQQELEYGFIAKVAENDQRWSGTKGTNNAEMVDFANTFSNTQAQIMFNRWKSLSEYLLVKYMDGNIKKERNGRFVNNGFNQNIPAMPSQPPYSQQFYELIIQTSGDNHRVVK